MNSSVASAAKATSSSTSETTVSSYRNEWLSLCSVQLYLPPEYMINKDFLKEVFLEEKALLKLNEVNRVSVPLYDELAVINLWPMM